MTVTSATASLAGTTTTGASSLGHRLASPVATTNRTEAQDRFLKLLVAQLNNQDPMNPMDNAQMTSQIAQINTVTGIQQLNDTMKSMATQMSAMQVLQAGNLVGHGVLTEGNQLAFDTDGQTAVGAIDLAGKATDVKIQVTTAGGQVVDTVSLGALAAGQHGFSLDVGQLPGRRRRCASRVIATNGADAGGHHLADARQGGCRGQRQRRPQPDAPQRRRDALQQRARGSLTPHPSSPSRSISMSFQQGAFRPQRRQPQPRRDRPQHRQRRHHRHEVLARRVRRDLRQRGGRHRRHQRRPRRRGRHRVAAVHAGHARPSPATTWTWRSTAAASSRSRRTDGTTAYTRAGNFKLDKDGNIITNSGAQLMGYPTDTKGVRQSFDTQPLQLPTGSPIPAKQTTKMAAEITLDASAVVASTATPPTPLTTYGTSLTAFDPQGLEVPVGLYFEKTANNTWNVYTSVNGSDPAASTPFTLNFNTDGSLNTATSPGPAADAGLAQRPGPDLHAPRSTWAR